MIARNEEEFEKYQQMDIERLQHEPKIPGTDEIQPRLMQESELPDWLLRDPEEIDQIAFAEEEEKYYSGGKRSRKEVDYSDNLTEKQWLQAIEDGTLLDIEEDTYR
jgi:SWI/SNF-related matrix-associated actin-dependent regulator of chromatin subfamily A protein 2/4